MSDQKLSPEKKRDLQSAGSRRANHRKLASESASVDSPVEKSETQLLNLVSYGGAESSIKLDAQMLTRAEEFGRALVDQPKSGEKPSTAQLNNQQYIKNRLGF